jgi:hypothetical protein
VEAASIFYKKPEIYVNGTLTLDFTFDKGNYIGIVTLNDPETQQTFTSIFPFSVGYGLTKEILEHRTFIREQLRCSRFLFLRSIFPKSGFHFSDLALNPILGMIAALIATGVIV